MRLQDAPRFLTSDVLRAELEHWTYRLDWNMTLYEDPWEGPCLYVTMAVPDGYNHARLTDIRIRSLIPPMRSLDAFGDWLLWRMMQIEIHECREYLHRDGRPWVDPHDVIEPV